MEVFMQLMQRVLKTTKKDTFQLCFRYPDSFLSVNRSYFTTFKVGLSVFVFLTGLTCLCKDLKIFAIGCGKQIRIYDQLHYDQLANFAPLSPPMRNGANRDLLRRIFPRFAPVPYIFFEFWLVHYVVYASCG